MKKNNKLVLDLGFRPEGRESTKRALVNYLEKSVTKTPEKSLLHDNLSFPQQLSFDFLAEFTNPKPSKKSAS